MRAGISLRIRLLGCTRGGGRAIAGPNGRFRRLSCHWSISDYRAGRGLLGLASSLTFTCSAAPAAWRYSPQSVAPRTRSCLTGKVWPRIGVSGDGGIRGHWRDRLALPSAPVGPPSRTNCRSEYSHPHVALGLPQNMRLIRRAVGSRLPRVYFGEMMRAAMGGRNGRDGRSLRRLHEAD
jgi:hypothetical protein